MIMYIDTQIYKNVLDKTENGDHSHFFIVWDQVSNDLFNEISAGIFVNVSNTVPKSISVEDW